MPEASSFTCSLHHGRGSILPTQVNFVCPSIQLSYIACAPVYSCLISHCYTVFTWNVPLPLISRTLCVAFFFASAKTSWRATDVGNENGDSFPPSSDKRSLDNAVEDHTRSLIEEQRKYQWGITSNTACENMSTALVIRNVITWSTALPTLQYLLCFGGE